MKILYKPNLFPLLIFIIQIFLISQKLEGYLDNHKNKSSALTKSNLDDCKIPWDENYTTRKLILNKNLFCFSKIILGGKTSIILTKMLENFCQ